MSDKKFYVTTPIYYVNARPHIGHAYTTIVADVLARRHRLLGEDTFFLTGTDEHGQKIERSAAAAGIPPQQFADQVSKSFEDLWHRMGITHNDYIRTTSPKHKLGVQHLFSELYKNGFIYLASYTGSYCVSDETFVDAPVGTPCPDCGRLLEEVTEENFFFKLSAFQETLIDLIESNTLIIENDARRNEVLAFLRGNAANLDRQSKQTDNPQLQAIAIQTIDQLLKTGLLKRTANGVLCDAHHLKDLSISRSSFTWGIPVPEPAASAAAQKHVIYVWLDALANYMTAIGYGSDDPAEQAKFKKFWPADLHLVGKEIIRFHCVYWPAFLLALNPAGAQTPITQNPGAPGLASETWVSTETQGPQLTFDQHKLWAAKMLPKAITAHGWLLFEDSKMSKSRGNIVRTETILDAFGTLCPPPQPSPSSGLSSFAESGGPASPAPPQPFPESTNRRGTASAVLENTSAEDGASAPEVRLATQHDRDLFASDVLRYFLLREIPFGQDGSFSFDALITRYNAELANGYGNLVSRTLNLIQQNQSGVITEVEKPWLCESKGPFPRVGKVETREADFKDDFSGTETIIEKICELADGSNDIKVSLYGSMTSVISLKIAFVDTYLTANAPWKLAKSSEPSDRRRMDEVLYTAAESIRIITALLYPILPYATSKVWAQLGLGDIELAARNGELANLQWGGLKPGTKLGPLGPIFPRADKGLAQIMTDMENPLPHLSENPQRLVENELRTSTTDPAAPPRPIPLPDHGPLPVAGSTAHTTGPDPTLLAPPTTDNQQPTTPQITIDDFAKIELRVAQILVAERIPKADKLLRLEVDLGPHGKRQILSGIAEFYTPEDLIGRRIVVITNLAPRKMRGLESHGMLLAASDGEGGKPVLATFGEDIALGSRLK